MRKIILSSLLAVILVLASCNIITEPVPVIGNYLVKNRVGSAGYIYCFSLKSDGTFTFIQRGGASTTETFIFKGTWTSSLNHFDFYSASGTIVFSPDEPKEVSYESLVFTVGEDNAFNFQWILDQGSVNATLSLDAVNEGLSNDIGIAQNISDTEFAEKLQDAEDKINGVQDPTGDEDDETGEDQSGEENTPPTGDEDEQPSPDQPGGDESDTGSESGNEPEQNPDPGMTEEGM